MIRILMIENQITEFQYFEQVINGSNTGNYCLQQATNLNKTLSLLATEKVDLIVVSLPAANTESMEILQSLAVHHALPWLIYSPCDDSDIINQANQVGIYDFLIKEELSTKLANRTIQQLIKRFQATPSTSYEGGIPHQQPQDLGTTLLLAEDELELRELTTDLLESAGYKVLPAEDGQKALELFKENQDQIDVVLTDIMMPNMTGRELVEEVRKISPSIGVLFMSGFSQAELNSEKECLNNNTLFLGKPFQIKDLTDALDSLVKPEIKLDDAS